jgi:recombination protein RecA
LTAAEAEAEDGIADKHRGGAAMAVTQFMHRLHAALNTRDKRGRPNTTTVLGINQYRDNVNAGMYGNPLKIAGGWALKHGKLIDILVEARKRFKIKIGDADVEVGKEVHWEILKGKAGCHDGPKGSYNFYFGEHGYLFGADLFDDLIVAAVMSGVMEMRGAWVYMGETRIAQGRENAAAQLAKDPDLFATIRNAIFEKHGISFITKEDS